MEGYYLGADLGGTKTHILISDEGGRTVGFGESGPGNHEVVGYEGMTEALHTAFRQAIQQAGLTKEQIQGAGFGVAGYDWPSERAITLQIIGTLGLSCPVEAVNDAILGLPAGSDEGWGVAVVSGTGCNCWGWDRTRTHIGRVTGGGGDMGEAAGGSDLVYRALRMAAYEWTKRGPATALTPMLVQCAGASSLADMLEGLMTGKYHLDASAAPAIFEIANAGDPVAVDLVKWAGKELGELANCVIRQLGFEQLAFDVVQIGSLYDGSPLLTQSMKATIQATAPGARLVRLTAWPVIGAVVLGMEMAGLKPKLEAKYTLRQLKLNGCSKAVGVHPGSEA